MNKVLTERPRRGGHGTGRQIYDQKNRPRQKTYYRNREVDDSLKREPIRRRHMASGNPKEFSDLIQPLKRFLLSRVGRRWDEVWSEICQVLRGNGLQAQHVKDHVKQYVGGIPHSGQTYFRPEDWHNPSDGVVYVDEEGVLRKSLSRRREIRPKTYPYVRESENVEYHRINGCWFRIELVYGEVPLHQNYQKQWVMGKRAYVKNKRALPKKEAKRLNLEKRFAQVPPQVFKDRY